MSELKDKISRLFDFLSHGIWTTTNEDVRGVTLWLINTIKAVFLSVRFFTVHRIMERASALTYYTLLAMVPMFALLLGICRVIGVQDMIRTSLESDTQAHSEALRYLFAFAESYINQANNGLIVGVGAVMLLYMIFSLLGNVESVMNEIWQQKKSRDLEHKVTHYLSLIILVPLFLIISLGVRIFLRTYLSTELRIAGLSNYLLWLLQWGPYVLIILMFTLIYVVIPNCKVKIRNAFAGAVVAGVLLILFQWLYMSGQIWVSKYSAVYGSFAALPLLLLWMQASWIICLYGAELSYATQNIQNYNFENLENKLSRQDKDFLCTLLAGIVYHRFLTRQTPPTTVQLSEELHLPARVTGELVRLLNELDVIRMLPGDKHEPDMWQPGRSGDTFTVAELFKILHSTGKNDLKIDYKKCFDKEWKIFCDMYDSALANGQSMLIRDINTDGFKPLPANTVKENELQTNHKKSKKK